MVDPLAKPLDTRRFHATAALSSLWCVSAIWWPQHATSVQLAADQPCEVFIWPGRSQKGQGSSEAVVMIYGELLVLNNLG